MPKLSLDIEGVMTRILKYRNTDDRTFLHMIYSETEPMVGAMRGDRLDFSRVPVDRSFPEFGPQSQPATEYRLPERLQARVESFRREYRERRELLRRREEARNSPDYIEAMRILAEDIQGGEDPEIHLVRFEESAADAIGSEE